MDAATPSELKATEDLPVEVLWPLELRVFFGVVFLIIWLVNVVGNICTLTAFSQDAQLRTVHNWYICNLAVTDLLIGLSSLPFYAVYTLLQYSWPFGPAWCKGWSVIDFLVCAESCLTIILISLDRFLMVRLGPAQYPQLVTKRRTLLAIGVSWVLAFSLYGPAIIGYDHWRGYSSVEEGDCDVEFSDDFVFTTVTSVIEFFIPLSLISSLNTALYCSIHQRSQKVSPLPVSSKQPLPKNLNKERKAAKSLALLVTVFSLCWTPYTASTVILTLCDTCINVDLYQFFTWVLWANSSLNPLLYAVSSPRFRAHFLRYLTFGKYQSNQVRNLTTA